MTQAEFDDLVVWLADEWAARRIAGFGAELRGDWSSDKVSMDFQCAVGGVIRWGQAHGLMTVTVAVGERLKAALRRVRLEDETLFVRVAADG